MQQKIDQKTWRKKILLGAGILSLVLILSAELFIIHHGILPTFHSKSQKYLSEQPEKPTGNIVFTADTFGEYNLHGCEIMGSLTRRATLLGKFKNPLYLDLGNFTPEHPRIDKVGIRFIAEALQTMGLQVANFTKYDFVNLGETDVNTLPFLLVSANLRIQTPVHLRNLVTRCAVIPFSLRSKRGNYPIRVGITGITFNNRRMHDNVVEYEVSDPVLSLNEIKTTLDKSDLKILLFNGPFYRLKKVLAGSAVRFHLVMASQSLPGQERTRIRVHDVPAVFTDDYGRTLGHVCVTKESKGFGFKYTPLMIGLGLPESLRINKMVSRIEDALHGIPAGHGETK